MGLGRKFSGGPNRGFSGGKKFSQSGSPPYNDGSSSAPLPAKRNPIEPDPMVFKILRIREGNGKTLLMVNYPNCINFHGSKILLVDAPLSIIKGLKELDPHFLEEGSKAPILARFRPTEEGWEMGVKMLSL